MKYSVETLPRMDADIKKKADLNTNNVFKGNNDFKKMPTVNGDPIVTNELNGTNYLMVYGTGTPAENAAELQAAYDDAKNMPRYLGEFSYDDSFSFKKGQTYYNSTYEIHYRILLDFDGLEGDMEDEINRISIEQAVAKSTRTTVVVTPGEYNFGATAFAVNAPGINIVSLTSKKDVLINSINVSSDYVYVSGVNCGTGVFTVSSELDNIIIENCEGGDGSFGSGGTASGTFNNCIGGDCSFGAYGTASGTFNYCTAGDNSFGGGIAGIASGEFNYCTGGSNSFGSDGRGGIASGTLINCRLTSGTFKTPTGEGKIYNCIDGSGTLVNYPPLVAPSDSSDSKVKLITLDDPQDSQDDPTTYSLTMEDNGATLIVNDENLTSTGLVIFDFSKFTLDELSKPFAVTIVGVGHVYAAYKSIDEPVVQLTSGESFDKTIMLCRDPRVGLDTPFARILG